MKYNKSTSNVKNPLKKRKEKSSLVLRNHQKKRERHRMCLKKMGQTPSKKRQNKLKLRNVNKSSKRKMSNQIKLTESILSEEVEGILITGVRELGIVCMRKVVEALLRNTSKVPREGRIVRQNKNSMSNKTIDEIFLLDHF